MKMKYRQIDSGNMIGGEMRYIYINTNCPDEKLDYSYSTFGGEDFMDSWKEIRESFISSTDISVPNNIVSTSNSPTEILFINWIDNLLNLNDLNIEALNLLLKRFEVTKKIYSTYDENFRPTDKKAFKEFYLYTLFAYVLALVYEKTGKLQYLNALLKVNDINIGISIESKIENNRLLEYCLLKELEFIAKLRIKLS